MGSDLARAHAALRIPEPCVPLHLVDGWLPETTTRVNPESILIEREEQAEQARAQLPLARLALEDEVAAHAIALVDGIGCRPHRVGWVALLLRRSEPDTLALIARGRARLAELEGA